MREFEDRQPAPYGTITTAADGRLRIVWPMWPAAVGRGLFRPPMGTRLVLHYAEDDQRLTAAIEWLRPSRR